MAFAACSIAANALTYEENVKLAATPTSEITASNASTILDAAVVVTNYAAFIRVANAKALDFTTMYAKLKGNFPLKQTYNIAASILNILDATADERFAVLKDFIAAHTAETDLEVQKSAIGYIHALAYYPPYCRGDAKRGILRIEKAEEFAAFLDDVTKSSNPCKWTFVAMLVYPFHRNIEDYILEKKYIDSMATALKSREVRPCTAVFDVASALARYKRTDDLVDVIDYYWYEPFYNEKNNHNVDANAIPYVNFHSTTRKSLDDKVSQVRKDFLSAWRLSESTLLGIAKHEDIKNGDKTTTSSIWTKLTKPSTRLDTALYLGDDSKVVDALLTADDTLSTNQLTKAIVVLNSLDPDFRAVDVKKALRVINKKYTLKLYDDRDSWEPVISKVRALIDIYSN